MTQNRQQRRQEGRQTAKTPHYSLNPAQVKKITQEAISQDLAQMRKDILNYATTRAVATFLVALHDEFGFGQKRLQQLLEKSNSYFDCIEAGTVSLDDMIFMCENEFNIRLEATKNESTD